MTTKARRSWDELNQRQETYLEVIYNEDQGLEAERALNAARGRWSSTPAHIWRRVAISGSYAPVPGALRARGVWESGAGSTLGALAERGLITYGDGWVLLTRAGRAAARAGLNIVPVRQPAWAISEWLWRQLAKVAGAGPEGLPTHDLWGTAHLYLQEGYGHEPGNRPYIHVVVTCGRRAGASMDWERRRYHLTDAGRTHYAEHLAEYREMYPDIDAPDRPPPSADSRTLNL